MGIRLKNSCGVGVGLMCERSGIGNGLVRKAWVGKLKKVGRWAYEAEEERLCGLIRKRKK